MRRLTRFLCLLPLALAARAEDIVFPPDAGVIDVTKSPYFARGDGQTDDTEAIQQALLEHPNGNRIIYLPNGTYLVSSPLRWPGSEDEEQAARATILQGQSRAGTVIRLLDYAPGFGNSGRPRAVVWTGDGPAYHERNAVRNLTLNTGQGNSGAIGLQFMANRQGSVRDVTIVAGGKGGLIGLDLAYEDHEGPCLLQRVRVQGFDVGIATANSVYSVTMEDIELEDQLVAGIRNRGQVVSIRHLRSTNSVMALQNTDASGFVTLLDANLQGLPAKRMSPAIQNKGLLFARQIATPGYTNAIENRTGFVEGASGPEVREFVSHPIFNVFPAPPYALLLKTEETPGVPWDALGAWASPAAYGGKGTDQLDDSGAIQAAVDSGAATIYLPNGTWKIQRPVEIRKNVRRIIGCEARIIIEVPFGQAAFKLVDGPAPVVLVERLEAQPAQRLFLEQASNRALVLSSCTDVSLNWTGKGDVFLEDVSSRLPWTIPAGRRLFARQFCLECNGTKVLNNGGQFWVLGLKTEQAGTLIDTRAGGQTELLGGLCYSNGSWKQDPMFRLVDASATFCISETPVSGYAFQTIVSETRRGVTRQLSNRGPSADQPLPEHLGGIALPLYSGYDGIGAVAPKTLLPNLKTSGN
ncbi:MAG TPA: glycosyl hydrolase family 28-related protein [Candidatus Limnocylindria bacterium]|nr:glycosyl hydrolase family 28-related protein [Candidatus Limnocylindria bacterium]